MDLLETVLRSAQAHKYLENFRNEEIEARNLKLLSDQDLELMGIDDETARKNIIKHSKNLLFAKETRIDANVNKEYINIVLLQITNQMNIYNAALTCFAMRPDIINCDIQLTKAADSLMTSINELENELQDLKTHLFIEKGIGDGRIKQRPRGRKIIKGLLLSTFIIVNCYVLQKIFTKL